MDTPSDRADEYDDGRVRVDGHGVRLARYYFPLGRPRLVPWPELRGYDVGPLRWTGRYRLWGSHRPDRWFPLDLRRPGRDRMIVLDVPGIRPVLTPDDVDEVCRLLDAGLARRA